MPFWSSKKVKDPVCGMEVDPKKAVATHEYAGKSYHFCSTACKIQFVKDPMKYVKS